MPKLPPPRRESEETFLETEDVNRNRPKPIINITDILRKRKIITTPESVVDSIIQRDIAKRKKDNPESVTVEETANKNLEWYKVEFKNLMSNKFMAGHVLSLKNSIDAQKSTHKFATGICERGYYNISENIYNGLY